MLRAFREHSNQTLHSHLLKFQVCCFYSNTFHTTVNEIGYSGAESISKALQSNTSLTSLDISGVLFVFKHLSHTQQLTALEIMIMVLRAFREHSNQTLHSHLLIFHVCCFIKTPFTHNS